MAKVISIVNQKGGVGKTTSCINLVAALGKKNQKCLLIDVDAQGNSTSGLGINKKDVELSSYDLLLSGADTSSAIIETQFKNVSIIPSSINLAAAEIELANQDERHFCLKNAINSIKNDFDFIIIDCPPSLGLITLNALSASDSVIVPIQCEYYALEGLSQLMATVRQVKRLYNPAIELEGILLTMYDGRLNLTLQVVEEVKKFFPNKVYSTTIPRNVRLSEAPSYGMPCIYYDKASKGSKAYSEFALEFLRQQV